MTRTVGHQDRSEIVLDPVEAWHRGRVLDRMLVRALPARLRSVIRGTHADFDRLDESRGIALARRLNAS